MKNPINFLKTINLYIVCAFTIAILIVIVMDFYLFHIPQLFNKAHEIGNIVYYICMSIIAATVFYVLTNHYKEYQEKKHIYPYVKQKLNYVISSGIQMFTSLAQSSGVKLKKQYPDIEELDHICKLTHPLSAAPLSLGSGNTSRQANWKEYFNYTRIHSLKQVSQILNQIVFLEPEFINLLNKFEENGFFDSTEFFANINLANEDLYESHKEFFIEYISLLEKIEAYKNEKLKHY